MVLLLPFTLVGRGPRDPGGCYLPTGKGQAIAHASYLLQSMFGTVFGTTLVWHVLWRFRLAVESRRAQS